MHEVLIRRIAAVRAKRVLVLTGEGAVAAAMAAIGMLVVAMLLDAGSDLARGWRAILLACNALLTVMVAWRWGLQPLLRGADDDTLALAIERMEPAFASRLIASVQLGRAGALVAGESNAVVHAMIAQTVRVAEAVNFGRVIQTERLIRQCMLLCVVLLLGMGAYVWGGDWSGVLLQRAFLAHVGLPTKTRVNVFSGSFVVARGENAVLKAGARGVLPESGRAEIVYIGGRRQDITMQRSIDDPSIYGATVQALQESFRYRVHLNDGVSDWFEVQCEELPVLAGLTCTQIYPAYTGRAEALRGATELRLLAGSRLRLKVTASKPVTAGDADEKGGASADAAKAAGSFVVLGARDGTPAIAPAPLHSAGADGRQLTAEIALPENITGFSIHLVDTRGLVSQNAAFYPIELVADQPPAVRLTAPDRKEVLLTADATVRIGFVADDDYGVAQARIKYRVDGGAEQVIPLDIGVGENSRGLEHVRGYYPWVIGRMDLPAGKATLEGSTIEYFVEAQDHNNLTGPGIGVSEHFQLRIVSKAEKQAELIGKLHESFSSVRELSESQEKASADLGTLLREQPK